MKVFVSPFKNPFLNLALEDYFLRDAGNLPVAFFYVNRPCVVLGRFQNPWLETNLQYLVKNDIWLVRRQSGGGCVYHDEGNLNFSFITSDPMIDRNKHAELLKKAFRRVEIELQISPRNDLWLQDMEGEWKKISGSAYKQTKAGSFHHGTFLVSSDLDKLSESLKHTMIPKNSKAIASVRSKVISLQQKYPGISTHDVIDLVAFELKTLPTTLDESLFSIPDVQETFKKFTSWEWLWGETPGFELEVGEDLLHVYKGLMTQHQAKKFNLENVQGIIPEAESKNLFPDFESQETGSQIIF